MSNIAKIIQQLHPLEKKVIPYIEDGSAFDQILKDSDLSYPEVMRAIQWLQNRSLLEIKEDIHKIILLDKNGKLYQKMPLPERRLLKDIEHKRKSIDDIKNLSREEINAAIGQLKKRLAVSMDKDRNISITEKGKALLNKEWAEERFLKGVFPRDADRLKDEELQVLDRLKKRKDFIKIEEDKRITIKTTKQLTDIQKEKTLLNKERINQISSDILKEGSWKGKEFRAYDIKINVPKVQRGKKHFVNEVIGYVKDIWIELGFKEMTGNIVQNAFWDLDILFVPQDHPAREMQDTYYLDTDKKKVIPPKLLEKVSKIHENGGLTESKGWQYKFSKAESSKLLLRTHTTVLSAQKLYQLKTSDLPAKFFAVGKVFRNETLDYSHLFEFYQVEGIVVDRSVNFRNLKGYLEDFYKKMGYDKIRIRPAHFPYTEPSCEVDIFHPVKKEWIELGGAGMFRPEVVEPLLGKGVKVLAWGLGLGRITAPYFEITDIRDFYKNDIKELRDIRSFFR